MANTNAWHPAIKTLHWILFLLVIAVVYTVFTAAGLEKGDPDKGFYMMLHKSFGVTIFLFALAWLVCHLKFGRPAPIGQPWQTKISLLVHWGMALLLLGMPLFGLLMSQFAGRPVDVFGLFSIPVVLDANKELAGMIHTLHAKVAAPTLITLVLLHIGGALWHHFVDKDDTLKRMRPL